MQAPFFSAKQQIRIHEWNYQGRYYEDDPNKEYKHEVCLLKLKAGGHYVLDLAAAQYGYYDPVYHAERYMPGLQAVGVDKGPLAGYELHWLHLMQEDPDQLREVNTSICRGHIRNSKAIDEAIAIWEDQNSQTMAGLLRAEEQAFVKGSESLVAFINSSLKIHWAQSPARLDVALGREVSNVEKLLEKLRLEQSGSSSGEHVKKK